MFITQEEYDLLKAKAEVKAEVKAKTKSQTEAESWAKSKTPAHWAKKTGSSLAAIKWAIDLD